MSVLGWLLNLGFAGGEAAEAPAVAITRYALDGTAATRLAIDGTDASRLALDGTNDDRLILEGS